MYSKNPYTRSGIKHIEPPYQQYFQEDYYQQPQQYPYYQQPTPPYYQLPQTFNYQQPQPSYYQQPQPTYYEQSQPTYYDQPYPPYQATLSKNSFIDSSFRPFSNHYGGDGMITDIEYLDFPSDLTYKKTPLNQRSHNRTLHIRIKNKDPVVIFFTILIEQLNIERQIEELKRKLNIAQDFHIPSLFQLMDKNNNQYLVFDEMYQGFQEIDIKVDYTQLQLVYKRFLDINSNDRMSFQQFEALFLPLGQTTKGQKRYNILPGPQTKSILNELMRFYQTNELRFENSRAQLLQEGIDMSYVYQKMDTNKSKNIGLNEFMNALNHYSAVKVVPSEAALLFMRFDRSRNGTISFMEFKKEMELKLK